MFSYSFLFAFISDPDVVYSYKQQRFTLFCLNFTSKSFTPFIIVLDLMLRS